MGSGGLVVASMGSNEQVDAATRLYIMAGAAAKLEALPDGAGAAAKPWAPGR